MRKVEEEAVRVRVVAHTDGMDSFGIGCIVGDIGITEAFDVGNGKHGDKVLPVRFYVVYLFKRGCPSPICELEWHVI